MKTVKTKYRIVKVFYYYDDTKAIKSTNFIVEKRLYLFKIALPLWKVFKYRSEDYNDELHKASFKNISDAEQFIKLCLEKKRKIKIMTLVIKEF